MTGHLVYWAKATVIYPLCESNVYVIAPDAPTDLSSPLVERFSEQFPGICLLQVSCEINTINNWKPSIFLNKVLLSCFICRL